MKTPAGIGALFLLSLVSYAADPLYTATASIMYQGAPPANLEEVVNANLPKGDKSVSVCAVPQKSVFEISATASDAKAVAKRANQVALSLMSLLNDPNDDRQKPVLMMTKAVPADAVLRSDKP